MELREQHIQLASQSAESRENWEAALLARTSAHQSFAPCMRPCARFAEESSGRWVLVAG